MNKNGLFIFRRDLRLIDNVGLNELSKVCKKVYTIFIFTDEQIKNNKYKSEKAISFMQDSINDLKRVIHENGGKLYTFKGDNISILEKCIKEFSIDIVSFNIDITPYAIKRDKEIEKLCLKMGIEFLPSFDYFLNQPLNIKQYKKFTPYYNYASKLPVSLVNKKIPPNLGFKSEIKTLKKYIVNKISENLNTFGGRENAMHILQSLNLKNYATFRNDLSRETSSLSAYIKFGNLSIREVYHKFKHNKEFIKQLYWRDFYASIMYYFPHVLKGPMIEKFSNLEWNNDSSLFKKWTRGETGYPIVDAGMKELLETGYMHNRARLICATFLIKILGINWQKGERFFAQHLIDYDPASNNGNWQWCASTGTDSQPYFRIFNPWLQSAKHDPECLYIYKWLPMLKDVPIKHIHKWYDYHVNYSLRELGYYSPIVDYNQSKDKTLKRYKKIYNK